MTYQVIKAIIIFISVLSLSACAYQPATQPVSPAPVTPQKSSQLSKLPAKTTVLKGAGKRLYARRMDQKLLSAAIFQETNVRRQQTGRSVLRHDARLDRAALLHAERMVKYRFFDHINPRQANLRTPKERVLSAGFNPRYVSENIATHFDIRYKEGTPVYKVPKQKGGGYSYTPEGPPIAHHTYRSFAVSLLDQWMASKGHRRNILSKYPTRFGAGCAVQPESSGMDKLYCVQLFGAPME